MAEWKRGKLGITVILLEIAFLVLFGVFVRYDDRGMPTTTTTSGENKTGNDVTAVKPDGHASVDETVMTHVTKYYASM